jgi:glycosyltransferase involved in cell wall biosynthesis
MLPFVSVIIPTYNRLSALAELLEALARQSFANFEVIIVNDGGVAVDQVVELYPELRTILINNEVNLKHVHTRNRGLEAARGEWIMLCDDDDLMLPGHLERMLIAAADADLVYSDVEIVDFVTGEDDGVRYPTSRRLFAYELDLQGMREFSTFVSSGCLYRRSLHDQIGLFDAEMYHYWDWDFFLRVAASFRVKRVPEASVLYAFGDSGDHQSGDLSDMRPYLKRLCEKHQLGELPTKNFFLLLEEPGVKNREAASQLHWDGQPIRSRWQPQSTR